MQHRVYNVIWCDFVDFVFLTLGVICNAATSATYFLRIWESFFLLRSVFVTLRQITLKSI